MLFRWVISEEIGIPMTWQYCRFARWSWRGTAATLLSSGVVGLATMFISSKGGTAAVLQPPAAGSNRHVAIWLPTPGSGSLRCPNLAITQRYTDLCISHRRIDQSIWHCVKIFRSSYLSTTRSRSWTIRPLLVTQGKIIDWSIMIPIRSRDGRAAEPW